MLRSSRMVPRPRFTLRVERKMEPSRCATSLTSSGSCMSGAVAISMSGMPRRSNRYVTSLSLVSTLRAASSSRQSDRIPIRRPFTSRWPSAATRAVRWKPLVFEPSMTILRMKCTSSIARQLSMADTTREACMASSSASCGGSSSASTRQDTSPGA